MSRTVVESDLENYLIELLEGKGWQFVKASELGRESTKEPILEKLLFRKILEINKPRIPTLTNQDVSRVMSILKGTPSGMNGVRRIIEYLKDGVPVTLEKDNTLERILLIDYGNPLKNSFIVSRQVPHLGAEEIRNDIILYVNGIPLVNIECKNPTDIGVSWEDAFRQIKRYERTVPELYKYVQIGVAAEATIKYFPIASWAESVPIHEWKDPDKKLNPFEAIAEMLSPEILLDIIRNFLYFRAEQGKEIKILPRYMQYYAVNRIVERVMNRIHGKSDVNKGLIWHWQGSGKTLTMIFAAIKLYRLLKERDPFIMFIVDRVELQDQLYYENLTKLDLPPGISAELITSIEHLKRVVSYKDYYGKPGIYVSTVHKFDPKEFEDFIAYLKAISPVKHNSIMKRKEVILLIDEAHRTQYGDLAKTMMGIFANGNFFAFTGTPAPRRDPKKNTFRKFSPEGEDYLHRYFILESIEDGFTVKIAYQRAKVEYNLQKDLLEEFLESELEELPEEERRIVEAKVQKKIDEHRADLIRRSLEDESRIDNIAKEIAKHFQENLDGKFKAMVVAVSRKACVLYKRALDRYLPPEYSEVVMTFQNDEKEKIIAEYKTELEEKYKTKDLESIMKEIAEKFKEEEYPKILIVTDKLLTGFDAPILQTMYLDKPMKGHTLLQAIARVNRPYKGIKEFGLVVDYVGIFSELEKAFKMYEKEDLKGAVYDIEELYKDFKQLLNKALAIVGHLPPEELRFKVMLDIADKLAKEKELEREFLSISRKLMRLFEKIYEKTDVTERRNYAWVIDVYSYYVKNTLGEDETEKLVRKYFNKTLAAVQNFMKVSVTGVDPSMVIVDREFFEKFIHNGSLSDKEKAKGLLLALSKFTRTEKSSAVYDSVADKVNQIIEAWRKKLKKDEELYEEAKRIWEEIYEKKREQQELGFSELEFALFNTFIQYGANKENALKLTKELIKRIEHEISVPEWSEKPAIVDEVEKKVAFFVLIEGRKAGLSSEKNNELISTILEKVKYYGSRVPTQN